MKREQKRKKNTNQSSKLNGKYSYNKSAASSEGLPRFSFSFSFSFGFCPSSRSRLPDAKPRPRPIPLPVEMDSFFRWPPLPDFGYNGLFVLSPDPELVLFKGGLLCCSSSNSERLIGIAPAGGIGILGIEAVEDLLLWWPRF